MTHQTEISWPPGLDHLTEALADTLHVPRPVVPTPATEREYHRLLRGRVAHARDALLALHGDGPRPDLTALAGWLYMHAPAPTYRVKEES